MLFPDGGVSDIQRKQMVTTTLETTRAGMGRAHGRFRRPPDRRLARHARREVRREVCWTSTAHRPSSASSINWGGCRLRWSITSPAMPNSWRRARSRAGCPIDVRSHGQLRQHPGRLSTPSKIGVPHRTAAVRQQRQPRALTDFINTGTYDISDREFILTSSPSMDILVSSNLERQLFELTGRNGEAIRQWMAELADGRCFRVDAETFRRVRENFSADSVDNAACLATIREVLDAHDYLLDPHTAVAYAAAQNLRGENPVLIASTARWAAGRQQRLPGASRHRAFWRAARGRGRAHRLRAEQAHRRGNGQASHPRRTCQPGCQCRYDSPG
ncbi:MAG: hypothetical protein ACLTDR_04840 [Adlercreutzia equolifaciens]